MPTIVVNVEPNENCEYPFQYFFNGLSESRPVRQVRLYHEGAEDGALYDVTGWAARGGARAPPWERLCWKRARRPTLSTAATAACGCGGRARASPGSSTHRGSGA